MPNLYQAKFLSSFLYNGAPTKLSVPFKIYGRNLKNCKRELWSIECKSFNVTTEFSSLCSTCFTSAFLKYANSVIGKKITIKQRESNISKLRLINLFQVF